MEIQAKSDLIFDLFLSSATLSSVIINIVCVITILMTNTFSIFVTFLLIFMMLAYPNDRSKHTQKQYLNYLHNKIKVFKPFYMGLIHIII